MFDGLISLINCQYNYNYYLFIITIIINLIFADKQQKAGSGAKIKILVK